MFRNLLSATILLGIASMPAVARAATPFELKPLKIDLPDSRKSGLVEAIDVVGDIEGISFVYFDERDVVRHNLVQRIIKAYEEHTGAHGSGANSGRGGRAAGANPPGAVRLDDGRSRE